MKNKIALLGLCYAVLILKPVANLCAYEPPQTEIVAFPNQTAIKESDPFSILGIDQPPVITMHTLTDVLSQANVLLCALFKDKNNKWFNFGTTWNFLWKLSGTNHAPWHKCNVDNAPLDQLQAFVDLKNWVLEKFLDMELPDWKMISRYRQENITYITIELRQPRKIKPLGTSYAFPFRTGWIPSGSFEDEVPKYTDVEKNAIRFGIYEFVRKIKLSSLHVDSFLNNYSDFSWPGDHRVLVRLKQEVSFFHCYQPCPRFESRGASRLFPGDKSREPLHGRGIISPYYRCAPKWDGLSYLWVSERRYFSSFALRPDYAGDHSHYYYDRYNTYKLPRFYDPRDYQPMPFSLSSLSKPIAQLRGKIPGNDLSVWRHAKPKSSLIDPDNLAETLRRRADILKNTEGERAKVIVDQLIEKTYGGNFQRFCYHEERRRSRPVENFFWEYGHSILSYLQQAPYIHGRIRESEGQELAQKRQYWTPFLERGSIFPRGDSGEYLAPSFLNVGPYKDGITPLTQGKIKARERENLAGRNVLFSGSYSYVTGGTSHLITQTYSDTGRRWNKSGSNVDHQQEINPWTDGVIGNPTTMPGFALNDARFTPGGWEWSPAGSNVMHLVEIERSILNTQTPPDARADMTYS